MVSRWRRKAAAKVFREKFLKHRFVPNLAALHPEKQVSTKKIYSKLFPNSLLLHF